MYIDDRPDHLEMLRDSVRRFVTAELPRDVIRRWDRERHFPVDVWRRLADLGVCGLTIDESYGGLGRDIVAAVAVVEELFRRGSTLGGPYIHCAFYAGMNISENGSEWQKRELLPKVARGELLFAYGLSEPDVGADLASVSTTARRVGDKVVINGSKRWCTASRISQFIYCLCKSDASAPRHDNLTLVLIPTDAAGITIDNIEHMGLGYAHTTDVTFNEVVISEELIVGGPQAWNRGWPMLVGPGLDVEKLEVAAMAVGIAAAAVEDATAYAQERRQFGKPISAYQAVRHTLADAHTKLNACRLMLYHAASLAQRGRPCSQESSMAKLFACDTGLDIVVKCQQVLGAYGCAEEYDMKRYVSDALTLPIIGGSSNIQRNNIARRMGLASA